jgi:hypothetical protein
MANAQLLLDYLFLGDAIRAMLVQALDGQDIDVVPIESVEQAIELSTRTMTAFVLWERDSFNGDTANGGRSQMVSQVWTVLLSVRNASQVDQDGRNKSAGPHLSTIHKALAGWAPVGALRSFKRTNGRQARYTGGTALYPLSFSIDLIL